MSKRLYFDCPIKALYMMKEFGIEFKVYEKQWSAIEPGYKEALIPFERFYTNQIDTTSYDVARPVSLVSCDFGKIYVCKESETIFEPKEGDYIKIPDVLGFNVIDEVRTILKDQGDRCLFTVSYKKPWMSKGKEIIMRDNKQFFMPEVEND